MKVRVDGTSWRALELLFPGIRTHEPLLPQLAEVALRVVASRRAPTPIVVAAGVSGLTERRERRGAACWRSSPDTGVREVDARPRLGHLVPRRARRRSGAVVAAGTGVVTLGVGAHSVARVDGWGNIMGDAGSGYWIGREALDAVMRAHDGRGEPTALTAIVRERWPDLESAYIDLQAAEDRVRVVASFANAVSELRPPTRSPRASACARHANWRRPSRRR